MRKPRLELNDLSKFKWLIRGRTQVYLVLKPVPFHYTMKEYKDRHKDRDKSWNIPNPFLPRKLPASFSRPQTVGLWYVDVAILCHFCFPLLPSPTRGLFETMTWLSCPSTRWGLLSRFVGLDDVLLVLITWQKPREPVVATCPVEDLIPVVAGDILTREPFYSTVSCTFSCIMKFTVKDCDPTTGETDDEGYEDEYVVRS